MGILHYFQAGLCTIQFKKIVTHPSLNFLQTVRKCSRDTGDISFRANINLGIISIKVVKKPLYFCLKNNFGNRIEMMSMNAARAVLWVLEILRYILMA